MPSITDKKKPKTSQTKAPFLFIGIDEAGRGPLAGPVSVGAVAAPFRRPPLTFFPKIRDSKQLSAQKRRAIYAELKSAKKRGELIFSCSFVGATTIDKKGISYAIHLAIKRTLKKLNLTEREIRVLLDGGLRAPAHYKYQETIIRGDENETLIALASIVAKVSRDEKMERLSLKYPNYQLEEHKGYGTAAHVRSIRKHGPSPLHRKTFLKNI